MEILDTRFSHLHKCYGTSNHWTCLKLSCDHCDKNWTNQRTGIENHWTRYFETVIYLCIGVHHNLNHVIICGPIKTGVYNLIQMIHKTNFEQQLKKAQKSKCKSWKVLIKPAKANLQVS